MTLPAIHKKRTLEEREPDLGKDDQKRLHYERVDGKIFARPLSSADVVQGELGDCYVMGALAALADQQPAAITKSISESEDHYEVRFHHFDKNKHRDGTEHVVVSKKFPLHGDHFCYANGDPHLPSRLVAHARR